MAERIFSQSAPGYVSSAYFRNSQVGPFCQGFEGCKFSQVRKEGRRKERRKERRERRKTIKEDEEGPELDSSGDGILMPVKRRRPLAASKQH